VVTDVEVEPERLLVYSGVAPGTGTPDWLIAFRDNGTTLAFGLTADNVYEELTVTVLADDFDDTWRHVAVTYDGEFKRLFIEAFGIS
jgi:hypothetical protein